MGKSINDRGFGMKDCGIGFELVFLLALAFDDSEGFFEFII